METAESRRWGAPAPAGTGVIRGVDRKDIVRRRVLAAWGELLAEDTYGTATMADVAERARLARSSVYRYFPDKESLLFAFIEERISSLVAELREEVYAAGDAPGRLRRFVVGELRRLGEAPEIVNGDVPSLLSREGQSRLSACFEPLRDLAREILEQGQAEGSLSAVEVDNALPMVLACVDVFRDALSRRGRPPEAVADDVADFVLRGLGAPPRGGPSPPSQQGPGDRGARSRRRVSR